MLAAWIRPTQAADHKPRQLLLGPASVYGHKLWFADEREPIADAVAQVLATPKHGFDVVPPKELRALWAEAQKGRLPGLKLACTAPPPPALLAEYLHPHAHWGRIEVRCTKVACQLLVDLYRRLGPLSTRRDIQVARLGTALPVSETPAEWATRIRQMGLTPRTRDAAQGGLGIMGTLGGEHQPGAAVEVELAGVEQSGSWAYKLDSRRFATKATEFHACVSPKAAWHDWWSQPIVIMVNGDGRISRCEAAYPDRLPPPELPCQCTVLAGIGFGRGAPDRRASFNLKSVPPGPAVADPYFRNAYFTDKRSDDQSAILGTGEIDTDESIACLASIGTSLGDRTVPVHFAVGADGHAIAMHARWPRSIPKAAADCLADVLGRARFNCPLSGHAEIDAKLFISVSPR